MKTFNKVLLSALATLSLFAQSANAEDESEHSMVINCFNVLLPSMLKL